jgi:protein O-GlcNAc transferase
LIDRRALAAAEAALKSGQRDEARRHYDKLAKSKAPPEESARLGAIAHALGLAEDAVRHMQRAAASRPKDPALQGNLGALLQAAGRLDEARTHLERAIKLKPDFASAHYNLGIVHAGLGDPNAAAASYLRAIAIEPRHAGAHLNLANLLGEAKQYEDAVKHYRLSLAARPQPTSWINLGNTLKEQGYWRESGQAYAQALKLGAGDGARLKAAAQLPLVPESEAEIEAARTDFAQRIAALAQSGLRIADPSREVGSTHFALAYQGGDDKDLALAMARLLLQSCPGLDAVADHCRAPSRHDGPLRVGICSRFLRDHSIGRLMLNLIQHMATTGRYALHVFTFAQRPDAVWNEISGHAVEALNMPLDLAAARREIAARRLDVLLYPDIGMEPMSYFLGFARLAPVQCVTWGHPVTTGIPNIDYFLSCDAAEPEDGEQHYSENLVRLGGLPMSYRRPKRPDPPKTRADFGLPDDARIYFCAQNLFKIHPQLDALFARILDADPLGRLLLLHGNDPHWAELLLQRYRAVMPQHMDRVVVLPRQSHDGYMSLLALSDVSLDSLPFSGGNTTYQALAMGTPVVTLPGRFLRGRLSLAIYAKAGVLDLVAENEDDYVRLAVRAATERAWCSDVMGRIEAAAGVIYDDREYLEDVERFLARVATH